MRYLLLTTCLAVLPVHAAAQSSAVLPPIESGTRVRVWASPDGEALKARVQAATPQTLELAANAPNTPRTFEIGNLTRVDVSRGRNRLVWTAGGMLAGATAGVILTRADGGDESGSVGGIDEVADGIANTISGALIGGVIGFVIAPERWRTVWRQ